MKNSHALLMVSGAIIGLGLAEGDITSVATLGIFVGTLTAAFLIVALIWIALTPSK